MKTTVAAIDFGTSKIVTLVASHSNLQRCDIIGAGIANYDGYIAEGWNNPGALDECILSSIQDAERNLPSKVREIYVGVPAPFTRVHVREVAVALKGTDPTVSPDDVTKLFAEAEKELGTDLLRTGVLVHTSPAWFMVDGGKKTLEPVGLKGRELRGLISLIVADRFFVDEVHSRLINLGYQVAGFFSTAAGESNLFLPQEERDHMSVLIDIGYLTTDVMICEGDALLSLTSIDMGGGNLSAELAYGLELSMKEAEEKVKRKYVFGIDSPTETFEVPGLDNQKPLSYTRKRVEEVLLPQVDELCEEINAAIENSGVKLGNWSKVYLTGGGLSFNRGARDYIASKIGHAVRETIKPTSTLTSYVFASSLGLIDLIVDTINKNSQQSASRAGAVKNFFHSLWGM